MEKDLAVSRNQPIVNKGESPLSESIEQFFKNVFPYLTVSQQKIDSCTEGNSAVILDSMRFFKLTSCTTEDIDDLAAYLTERMNKLLTAIHSLNETVVYGVISYNGQTNVVLGIESKRSQDVVEALIKGLLTGIELTPYDPRFTCRPTSASNAGILSAVPILKIDEDKQHFDISTLMRSLNGENYTVLSIAKPYPRDWVQDRYKEIIEVRDNCFAISKENRSIQENESVSDTNTSTQTSSTTRTFTAGVLMAGIADGSSVTDSISKAVSKTIGSSQTVSYDVQNGIALELMQYCDKAIERLKYGQNIGMWGTALCYSAESPVAAKIIEACLNGELAKSSSDILPIQQFQPTLRPGDQLYIPRLTPDNPLLAPVTSSELSVICTPPYDSVPDFELKKGKLYPMISSPSEGVNIGAVSDSYRPLNNMRFSLSEADLNKHTLVCGITGSGKTTTVKSILKNCHKPFMVIEPAKKEYRNINLPNDEDLTIYTLGKPELHCLQFNPFYIQYGINLQTHIDSLKDLFNASFSFYGPMPYILEKCLYNIYRKKGWNLTLGYHPFLINTKSKRDVFDSDYMKKQYALKAHRYLFPTMQDLKDEVKRYIEEEMQYDSEVGGNVKTAIMARLESLCVGSKGFMFNTNKPIPMEPLMQKNVIFELEGLADDSDKAFCVGLLVIFINEYRQIFKDEHSSEKLGLQHLLVIEEAHRLLKNVDTERSTENMGNPKGKAVEHFSNMIAEMRSYGQGVIIAEQIPSKLAPDVIKNSSNKIIHRVVSSDDQALVANTIGMEPADAVYLGNLKTGYALCHKEGMSLPVHVCIDNISEYSVTDGALFMKRADAMFEEINYNLVKENTVELLDELSLKLLNTLMAEEPDTVIRGIKFCKKGIKAELSKRDVSLIFCQDEERLFGTILAENILCFLINGTYSFSALVSDDLYEKLFELFSKKRTGDVAKVKQLLSNGYMQDSKNRCITVISELIKMNYTDAVNIQKSIRQYFFFNNDRLFRKIEHSVREGIF